MKQIVKSSAWIDLDEYPFESQFHKVKAGRMHYVDVGRGQPIVMVHGTPTWSFAYRSLIKHLSGEYRCIAPDMLGFGLSDKPRSFSYKPVHHAENLDCMIQELGLRNIILVVHDYGGPIGLNYAIHNPHNVSRIVLMNTWMWSLKGDSSIQKLNGFVNKKLGTFLYEKMNFPARYLLQQMVAERSNLPKTIQDQYVGAFPTPESRRGALVLARELIGSSDWFETLWRASERIADIPTLLLWGMKDEFVDLDSLERWHKLFRTQRMIRLANAGHLVQEDQRGSLPDIVRDFLHEYAEHDTAGAFARAQK